MKTKPQPSDSNIDERKLMDMNIRTENDNNNDNKQMDMAKIYDIILYWKWKKKWKVAKIVVRNEEIMKYQYRLIIMDNETNEKYERNQWF